MNSEIAKTVEKINELRASIDEIIKMVNDKWLMR